MTKAKKTVSAVAPKKTTMSAPKKTAPKKLTEKKMKKRMMM
jgi:hypothetical protein